MALNQLKFDQLETGSVYPITASYALSSSAGSGGTTLTTGSTYPITSSWSNYSISSSYSVSSSNSFNSSTSSFSSNSTSASYSSTASVALNALTASYLDPISQSLIPSTGSVYSLGSPTNKWKDLYVSTGSIYIGETVLSTSGSTLFANSSPVVTLNTASGQLEVSGLTASLSSSYSSTASIALNALNALTSSYSLNSVSSSYSNFATTALSASYAPGGGTSLTTGSSYPITSSWSNNALTASYAINAVSIITASLQTGSIANQTILYNVTTSQDNVISGLNLTGNKWGVTVVEEWNSIPGDLNISSCSLLMHFSGSNGSTTFIDNSPNNFTVSANGNTKITSSISKFGGTSAYFDGTGDNLLINYNTALHLSGDFTIEVWFYPISLNDSFILNFAGGLNIAWASYELFVNANGVHFVGSSANNGYDIGSEGSGAGTIGTPTLNAWNHIAVTRQGNVYRGFINGVQGYTQTLALTPYNPNARGLAIGSNYANTWGGTPAYSINGYLDELRITKGVARYTASFVTQSVQFPDSLPQYETKYVGLVGGLNDTGSDYGVQKLDDTSLKIRKMSVSGTPVSGSPILSASVDRVYVNVLDYDNVSISGSISNAISSSYSLTASYNLNSVSSSFSNTSSYNLNSVSSSYALTASFSLNGGGGGTTLTTGSTYPITSSWATTSSNIIGGTSNYIPLWSTNTSLGNSVLYQSSNNIGIGTTSPGSLLHVGGSTGATATPTAITFDNTYRNAVGGNTSLKIYLYKSGGESYGFGLNNAAGIEYHAGSSGGSNANHAFYTETTEKVRITSGGNVGIGTTSPSYKLDVNGIIAVSNSPFADKTGNYNRIYNPSGDGCIYLGNVSDPGNYYDNTNHYFRNRGNTTTYVTINSNGNVGIGTTSPASILHLQSSAATTLLRIDNTNNSNDAAILLTDSTNPTGEGFRITYDSSVGDTYFNNIYTSSIQAFNFQKGDFGSGTSLLTILNSGNVGIGTTSPAYKLDVNGSASFADNVIITKNQNALTRLIVSNTTSNSNSYVETAFVNDVTSGTGAVGRYGSTTTTYKIVTSNNQYLYNGPTAGDIAILNDFASGSIKMSAGGNSNVQFIISSSGNVGIGTTSPSAKLHVNGNISASAFTGSVFGTSSWANNATTASFASTASYNLNSISSSYALTASFSLNGGGGGTTLTTGSTYPITSSWATNSITASYAMNGGGGGSVQTGNIANQTILYNVTTSQDNVISGLNLSSNKWGVTVVEEWNSGSVVLDNNYNSCSLLCHFDSLNFDGRFIDNSKNNLVITSSGNVIPSPSNYKFGGASAYFNGNGSYLTISTISSNLTNDFTIECWIYIEATNISYPVVVGADGPFYIRFGDSGFGYKLQFSINDSGVSSVYSTAYTQTSLVNQWVHLALTRTSSTVRFFINGVIQSLGTGANPSSYPVTSFVNSSTISSNNWYIGNSVYNGYIDELRITKDVARYTSSFTPQTFAFPNSATQIVTKYIGLVGGLNDSNVDYGVEKLSDSSLKIRKMTASGQPLSGSGALSASVDRVYVNVLDYTNVMVTSSYALTASYVLGGIQTGSISNQTILYNVTTSQDNTITGLDLSGNKWDVSVIEEWNSGSIIGDEYYNSCSLLMHFSGSNGSTTFIDNSPSPKTVTSNNGTAISTVQSKFGGASVLFDGTNDYLSIPNNTNFNLSGGSYTIECWIRPTGNYSGYNAIITKRIGVSASSAWQIYLRITTGAFSFYDGTERVSSVTPTANVWSHVAAVYNGSTINLYLNGVSVLSTAVGNTDYDAPIYIGSVPAGNEYFNGYIDELRITKGVARYTGSFVTQSTAFLDSQNLNQLQTKYVGLVGGINDSTVDYGVEKLSDTSLKIRKMSDTGQPLSGSGQLSASVDRVYVNVLNYKEVQTTAQSASYAVSASYLINAASGESFHPFLLG